MKLLRCLLVVVAAACDNTPDANAPQNPTPNPQYPGATATATAPAPTATTAATVAPTATATATAAPTPTVVATAPTPPPLPPPPPPPAGTVQIPGFPSFPTFAIPNIQLPTPQQLAAALPALPIDPNLLNQIKQVGEQIMNQGMLALGDPGDVGLRAASVRYAPLMLPEGAPYKDSLAAGGHKAFDVTLAGNKCYTIIAYSPPGNITDVSIHLLVPPFFNMDAGHDDMTNNTAVIGKAPAPICPFTLIPIPYRVDVSAKAGQGQIVVQVYSKSR